MLQQIPLKITGSIYRILKSQKTIEKAIQFNRFFVLQQKSLKYHYFPIDLQKKQQNFFLKLISRKFDGKRKQSFNFNFSKNTTITTATTSKTTKN